MQNDLFEKWYIENHPHSSLEKCEKGSYFRKKATLSLHSFKAGQQSQQGEVSKLQSEIDSLELKLKSQDHSAREVINAMSMSCGEYLKEIDDLQKRIDEAVEYTHDVHDENWQEVISTMLHILKGNKDEN